MIVFKEWLSQTLSMHTASITAMNLNITFSASLGNLCWYHNATIYYYPINGIIDLKAYTNIGQTESPKPHPFSRSKPIMASYSSKNTLPPPKSIRSRKYILCWRRCKHWNYWWYCQHHMVQPIIQQRIGALCLKTMKPILLELTHNVAKIKYVILKVRDALDMLTRSIDVSFLLTNTTDKYIYISLGKQKPGFIIYIRIANPGLFEVRLV